ncbi:AzlD domain-containing protein [Mangrovimicrobium sediminis]|uniref:AzlD domain-containing protein n=1 Tax=Mangrovimicrobium sediminis TaxID=2562682 RepID=A0A4Z0LYI5_9GAMM|nr:AzlD domain-containing protein [Haliea sp. SAOS-164]TGD72300.1 AzlD domain-containing protein [Haliea sp. SAOS-164]
MSGLIAIVIAGLGTYTSRALFILALANRRIPHGVSVAMEYVGPSVLAALVVALLTAPGQGGLPGAAELVALLVATLLAWKTRNHLLTLALAMLVFWALGALL